MSTVTLKLKNFMHAPWGLLTDEDNPRMIVWLTEEQPAAEIDSLMLTDWDVARIQQSKLTGIVDAQGIDELDQISAAPKVSKLSATPIVSPVRSKVAPSEIVMDVTTLMRQEAEKAKVLEDKIKSRYPKIDEILNKPANKVKKELKELAKANTLVSFFQECRRKEQEGKDRKSVIAVLVEIIQAKINAVGLDGLPSRDSGQTALSEAYYSMIEEYEDEDEGEVEEAIS